MRQRMRLKPNNRVVDKGARSVLHAAWLRVVVEVAIGEGAADVTGILYASAPRQVQAFNINMRRRQGKSILICRRQGKLMSTCVADRGC